MKAREAQPGAGHRVWRAVHVYTRRGSAVKSVRHLRQAAAECQVFCYLRRDFQLIPGGPARSFEFKAAVVRDVDLLVRVVNDEVIGARREALDVICGADLIEISGGDLWRVTLLNHNPRVLAVDAATVI